MAETSKRQSVGPGKAPAKGQAGAQELLKVIGARVRITLTQGSQSVEGIVTATDSSIGLIAIRDANSPNAPPNPAVPAPGNYRIIHVSQINNHKIVTPASGPDVWEIPKVDTEALKRREEQAIAAAKKAEANIGKGVTKEAQELFDHISRTLPTRWNAQQIIVSDSVIVDSPYGADNTKAPANKQPALAQVKRVIEGFWAKKQGGGSKPPTGKNTPVNGPPARAPVPAIPLGQRKGG